jgi:hypothetical protein
VSYKLLPNSKLDPTFPIVHMESSLEIPIHCPHRASRNPIAQANK